MTQEESSTCRRCKLLIPKGDKYCKEGCRAVSDSEAESNTLGEQR